MNTHHTDEKKPARGGLLDMEITGDELLFEVRGPCGKVWRLYLDGRIEGFPDGVTIQNYAFPLWTALAGLVIATPPSSCEGDQKRALVVEIENASLGDGNFKDAVARSLVLYAQAIQSGQAGDRRQEVFECPGGTVLKITALV